MADQNKDSQQISSPVSESPKSEENVLNKFLDYFNSIADSFSETVISWQGPYESEIFRIIDTKRKFEKLEPDEQTYFNYYRGTFRLELISALLTVPVGYAAYKYKQATSAHVKDLPKVNKYLKRLFLFGIPSINLFLLAFYRRYFYKHHYEDQLTLKYIQEIRALKRADAKKE